MNSGVRTASWDDNEIRQALAVSFERTRFWRAYWDKVIVYVLSACGILVLLPLFSILLHLISQGATSINIDFLTKLPKPVGEHGGGMANALVGTLILLGIALMVGVPVGLGAGIYLSEYSGQQFAQIVGFVTDVLNGIPSIVYGIFAYAIFVLPVKSFSALSGGIALGIMMIPTVTRTTEQFLRMVPTSIREAGLALGVPKWRVTLDIVLQMSLGGVNTGIMIALARVAGETAPLLFTAFGNRFWNFHLTEPIAALPLQIFSYAISPFDDWHRQAWAGALVLIMVVFLVNLAATYFVRRQSKNLPLKR